ELDRVAPPAGPAPAAPPDAPSLESRWTRQTAHESVTRSWVQVAVQRQEDRGEPVLPGSAPIAAAGRIVYRSYRGVHALDPRPGAEAGESPSPWSIDRLMPQARYAPYVESWFSAYLEVSPHVLFANTVLGTLSTDGSRVYAVDDLALPPYRNYQRFGGRW